MKNLRDEKNLSEFTVGCLLNESIYDYEGSVKIIEKYYDESNNLNEFTKKVLDDERLENNQGYWELVKEKDSENYNVRVLKLLKKISDNYFKTESDAGSLKIGNSSFSTLFSNGYGDCENLVFIINKEISLQCLEFKTTIEGSEINIYEYDCGNNIIETLRGKYTIYSFLNQKSKVFGEKIFAFVKCN